MAHNVVIHRLIRQMIQYRYESLKYSEIYDKDRWKQIFIKGSLGHAIY